MTDRATQHRQLFEVELRPVIGSRFQPAGFPDLGAAIFDRPILSEDGGTVWVKSLLVESPQSMANHLERTAWPIGSEDPHEVFTGLPYVRVLHADDQRFLTSSRIEAHRLASAFVKDSTLDGTPMREVIRERLGLSDDRPLSPRQIARAVFELDPFALVHGVFFAESAKVWPGQPKIQRALTAFIEATDVRRADSGGVKKDHVRHSLGEAEGGTAEGYGTVPFHRTEWTAARVVASFALDNDQINSYGLPEPGGALLQAIAQWEIRALLDAGLRLRTACDLEPIGDRVSDQHGSPLPTLPELSARVRGLIAECRSWLGEGRPLEVTWAPSKKKAKE
jgi:CRISPR-associated protein Csb1